ncbi:MAG: hydrogenase expression protein HupH [Firmicutes bacterium]|nr:hydrogenase expression protein HupH [Bacillota bacterium]
MKLKVIVPITSKVFEDETKEEIKTMAGPGVVLDAEGIQYGTASIESIYDELLCAPGIIKVGEKAQSEGFDGIFVSCMGDPAVEALREKLDIPVVGPCRTSMIFAADLASTFSVVTVLENVKYLIASIAHQLSLSRKLASVRSVDIPVLDLADKEKLVTSLINESLRAVREDGAHAIILGCTGMMGVSELLSEGLKAEGCDVPVIYPVPVAIKYLELLVSLGLNQSQMTYMTPTKKERNIWDKLS